MVGLTTQLTPWKHLKSLGSWKLLYFFDSIKYLSAPLYLTIVPTHLLLVNLHLYLFAAVKTFEDHFMNSFIESIYKSKTVIGPNGKAQPLHSAIDPEEGEFLFSLIHEDPSISKTLEVGCAFGLSSLFICSATANRPDCSHVIVDPCQNTQWNGVGIHNLATAGLNHFKLLETKSEIALPKLLESGEGQFDFIFIDGWHTFDHTLLDCFYATRLLRIGGILAVDDADWSSVGRVLDFVSNYPCYQKIGAVNTTKKHSWKQRAAKLVLSHFKVNRVKETVSRSLYKRVFEDKSSRLVALRKISEDERNWDWHNDFF